MQCSDEESAPSEKGDRVCTCCGFILSREKQSEGTYSHFVIDLFIAYKILNNKP